MSGDEVNPEALSRMRAHEPPPEGFDPHTAPPEVLRRYGLPRRPDPRREPDLAWLWKRALARPPTFVKAELAIDKVMSDRDPQGRRKLEFGPSAAPPILPPWIGPSRWAGIERHLAPGSDYAEPAWCVFTELRVPYVLEVAPDQPLVVAFWVGIDDMPNSILQAGVTALVDPPNIFGFGGGVSFHAWIEWFGDKSHTVPNFPISSGDLILIMVSADAPDAGNAFFHNLTTGTATSIDVSPPDNVTLSGTSVEWIVEAVTEYLPIFSTVNFDYCAAGTPHGVFYPEPGGSVWNIQGYLQSQENQYFDYTQTSVASPDHIVLVREKATNWF